MHSDAGATTVAPTLSSKLIEFIGDSITAGYTDSKYALSDYAWLIGEQLGVQHTQIAQSGICLVDNIQCYSPNAIGMSRQFFKLQNPSFPNSPNWDFSRYQPNAVVINLGTNDSGFSSITAATFQSTYETFLHNIRSDYPAARIFVLRTFAGVEVAPTQAAIQAVGDSNIQYIDTWRQSELWFQRCLEREQYESHLVSVEWGHLRHIVVALPQLFGAVKGYSESTGDTPNLILFKGRTSQQCGFLTRNIRPLMGNLRHMEELMKSLSIHPEAVGNTKEACSCPFYCISDICAEW